MISWSSKSVRCAIRIRCRGYGFGKLSVEGEVEDYMKTHDLEVHSDISKELEVNQILE